jgi:hypothetical protein
VLKYAGWASEYPPGTPAPAEGIYEQCNVLGSTTGVRITLACGQTMPASPRGFTWRVVEPPHRTGAGQDAIGRAARSAESE